eukprot:402140-Hanusia_phi.AAC.1
MLRPYRTEQLGRNPPSRAILQSPTAEDPAALAAAASAAPGGRAGGTRTVGPYASRRRPGPDSCRSATRDSPLHSSSPIN